LDKNTIRLVSHHYGAIACLRTCEWLFWQEKADGVRRPLAVIAQYLAGAFGNLLKWWLEAEMPYSAEQMESDFQQPALPGVWATSEGKRE